VKQRSNLLPDEPLVVRQAGDCFVASLSGEAGLNHPMQKTQENRAQEHSGVGGPSLNIGPVPMVVPRLVTHSRFPKLENLDTG
jgi:hypothetical protein